MANENGIPFNRHSFPKGFIFGTSSAAYQYEGEANKGNRGPSIWDIFVHENPERVVDHSNGDVAIDFYHRYKGDVKLMKDMGMDAFRFSISWSRVIPSGAIKTGVNKEGIQFYNDLINELVKNDIKPVATIFHWDLPQALEDRYGGFLSRRIVDDFRDFANLCFHHFGDRVKQWITLNEPWGYSADGYSVGLLAPGRRTAHETYIVAHHLLLAHAHAVKLYRDQYQAFQGGIIGFSNCTYWFEPLDPHSDEDKTAAKRSLDFMLGWFVEPVIKGHYPKSMQIYVGKRLPHFTPEEVELVKGSVDFLGINHYTTYYATKSNPLDPQVICYTSDIHATWTQFRNGKPIGPPAASSWLRIYPPGIKYLMNYIKDTYENPVIYITENGVDEFNHGHMTPSSLNDQTRIKYYKDYLRNLLESIKFHHTDVRGFFCWSLLDNFEWVHGYTVRFGLIFVDYTDDLRRYPKASAAWFKNFLQPPVTSSVAIEQEILGDEGNETAAGHPNPSQDDYELRSKRARVAGELMETRA